MECFNCHAGMQDIQRHQTYIKHCYTCGAYWFDGGALAAVLSGSGLALEAVQGRRGKAADTCRWCGEQYAPGTTMCAECARPLGYPCPNGHGTMEIIEEQGVELDHCATCEGIWFDGREFLELSRALKEAQGGAAMPRGAESVSTSGLAGCQVCGARVGREALAMQGGLWRCASCAGGAQDAASGEAALAGNIEAWRAQERKDRLVEGAAESVNEILPGSLLGALVRWLDH